jgi:hypothetical protein
MSTNNSDRAAPLTPAQIAAALGTPDEALELARQICQPMLAARPRLKRERLREAGSAGPGLELPAASMHGSSVPVRDRRTSADAKGASGPQGADPAVTAPAGGLTGTMADFDTSAG